MQTRPYPARDGLRIWLNHDEQQRLLDAVEDDPRRQIAFQLGLHGLRSDEILRVQPNHFRELDVERFALRIPDGKTGRRQTPVSDDLRTSVRYFKNAAQARADEPIFDVSKRTLRNWIADTRDVLAELDDRDGVAWEQLGMHDLRRSWATDVYYRLAFSGVPIAEQLTLSWGGWAQTPSGRETFRSNYLGPVPDYVTAQAVDDLALP